MSNHKTYNQIDFDQINELADPGFTFREVGMHVVGNAILCPGHMMTLGREDKNIGNCQITKHGCYCHSCGRGYSTIDSVALYLGISGVEAALKVASINNIGAYKEITRDNNKKSCYRKLTPEEKELLGLGAYSKRGYECVLNAISFSNKDNPLPKGQFLSKIRDEDGFYLICESVPISFKTLENDCKLYTWRDVGPVDDTDMYQWIVCEKIKEKYFDYKRLKDKLEHPLQNIDFVKIFYELGWNINDFIPAVHNILFRLRNLYIEFDGNASELDGMTLDYFLQYV